MSIENYVKGKSLLKGDTEIAGQTTIGLPLDHPEHTFATVPSAALHEGRTIYVSNGAAGSPIIAFSNGTVWLRVDTRGVITAS